MSYYDPDEIEDMVREDVEDAWEGEGEYVIAYSDGGQTYEPRWYATSDELAEDLRGAYADATETHLPYAERVERDERTKADFAALRETVGLTQANLADDMGVRARSVRRWEQPGMDGYEPPAEAWEALDGYADTQRQMVDHAREVAMRAQEEAGHMPDVVALTYWRSQEQYDEMGRDEGWYGVANANARAVASELARYGFRVEFRYPDDGAIATPGSRYQDQSRRAESQG